MKDKKTIVTVVVAAVVALCAIVFGILFATGVIGGNKNGAASKDEDEVEYMAISMPEGTTDYLFFYFKGDGGSAQQQIFLAVSHDGNTWVDLNGGEPILDVSDATEGDIGVRDPFIVRSPDGSKFYLIATDLCIGTGDGTHTWATSQSISESSKYIRVWESEDLVNWSDSWLAKVGITTSSYTWAPEVIWSEEDQMYMIYYAAGNTNDPDDSSSAWQSRTWYVLTEDFKTFTEPKLYASSVNDEGQIDMDIVYAGDNTYYRISSSYPDMMIEKSTNGLFGDWEVVSSLQDLGLNYGAAGNTTDGIMIVEGPEIFMYNSDDIGDYEEVWGILLDNYGGIGYFPICTTDLGSTSGSTYFTTDYDFDSTTKRHGTILNITAEEYEAVMAKWGEGVEVPEGSGFSTADATKMSEEPLLLYTFESKDATDTGEGDTNSYDGTLYGNAKVVTDSEKGNVLYLDGTNGTYLEFPQGFFDNMDSMTISMDVMTMLSSGDFFTFSYGKDNTYYSFLRLRDTAVRFASTVTSYNAESEVSGTAGGVGVWTNVVITINGQNVKLYIDGELASSATFAETTSDLGSDLLAYLGKSFYGADAYFNGYFDNVAVYYGVASSSQAAILAGLEDEVIYGVTASDSSLMGYNLDFDNKTVELIISKNSDLDITDDATSLDVTFELSDLCEDTTLTQTIYLAKSNTLEVVYGSETLEFTVTSVLSSNPVLEGQYADPDIDCFDGVYYIYPTTDGYSGWAGYQFHCFSSTDLVNWTDEGVILDVKNDNVAAKDNTNGYAGVPWADGYAWAPTIEEKDGKYYFYFCAKRSGGDSCIGVAVSDSPTGPFVAMDEPLITPETVSENLGFSSGQTIDPSIFTDDDGTSYIVWGNGYGAIAQLGDDMVSLVEGTFKRYSGLTDIRESLTIFKRNGIYHFLWSCDDTGSENYHVNYGYATDLYGTVTYVGTILSKDSSSGILGTGHQSVYYDEETDTAIIAYHRFVTPKGTYLSDYGVHRETCLDYLTFDEDGLIEVVSPTA